ncbi:MAG: hypothetical protein LBG86_00880 [Puniceicoccales bacterium]|jgi:hypothetical protein|nr:hypothetical protein [Puniceicoccales bacterium]
MNFEQQNNSTSRNGDTLVEFIQTIATIMRRLDDLEERLREMELQIQSLRSEP